MGKEETKAGVVPREAAAKKRDRDAFCFYTPPVLSRCADRGTALLGLQCSISRENR